MKNAPTVERFHWYVPKDVLALTHSGQIPMPLIPDGITTLAGTGAEPQIAVLTRIRSEVGDVIGIGCELEITPGPHSDVQGVQAYFGIVIPGQGALLAYEIKNVAPEVSKIIAQVAETGAPWVGELKAPQTVGPAEDGQGIVLAATGRFRGATGFIHQTVTYRRIEPRGVVTRNDETFSLTYIAY